ncbi:MAG: carbohydrate-binding protein, partial [Sedimentisphaerales bacterium]|nr:carbohydrate-binding protein [Sedimentisphaerales bacterium]
SQINGSLVATSDYDDDTAVNGYTYFYVVTAVDTNTNESDYSNEDSAMPFGRDPYPGPDPHAIPGTVQAEDYDTGGEGIAYHDTDSGNTGGDYRSDDVDVEACGEGNYNVGWIFSGEWLEYTVDVAYTGDYDIEFRVASNTYGNSSFHLDFGGDNVTGTVSFSPTGGWQTYTSVYATDVHLTAGEQIMRLSADSTYWNITWMEFTYVGGDATPPDPPTGISATPGFSAVSLDWNDNSEGDLAGYNVYRSTSSGSGYSQVNTTLLTNSEYLDLEADNGTPYYYVVTAEDVSTNESGYSGEQSATPTAVLYADFNGDSTVDDIDFPIFMGSWLASDCGDLDLNGDCVINLEEYNNVAEIWR